MIKNGNRERIAEMVEIRIAALRQAAEERAEWLTTTSSIFDEIGS